MSLRVFSVLYANLLEVMKTYFFFDSFYLNVLDSSINGFVDNNCEHVFLLNYLSDECLVALERGVFAY